MRVKPLFVYILASDSKVMYTGVTNDLQRRVYEHRSGRFPGFTSRYRIGKLVWWEYAIDPYAAIAREKQIKGWSRSKRIRLVEAQNPGWLDLAVDWFR